MEALKHDREFRNSNISRRWRVFDFGKWNCKLQVWKPLEDGSYGVDDGSGSAILSGIRIRLTENSFKFCTCQPFGNAPMSAPTKAERFLSTSFAVDVKGVRIGENLFVSITRLVRCNDSFASFYKLDKGILSQYHQY